MKSVGKIVKKTKQINDAAASGVKILKGYQEGANALAKEGKTLSDMQKAVKAMTFISKLNTGLAMASVGLTIAQMIFPVKTPQDAILEEINKLSNQLTDLKADINDLGKELKFEGAQEIVFKAFELVDKVHGHLIEYSENPSTETLDRMVEKQNIRDCDAALEKLVLAAEGTMASDRVLELAYNNSFGQVDKVTWHAFFLKFTAEQCVQSWVACRVAQNKKAKEATGGFWSEADSADLALMVLGDFHSDVSVSGKLRRISEACNYWSKKGLPILVRETNIKAKISDMFEHEKPAHEAYQQVAERMVGELSTAYPWQTFTAICYAGVSGYQKHAWKKSSGESILIARKRELDDNKGKMNILVLAAPNRRGRISEPYRTNDAFALKNVEWSGLTHGRIWTVGDQRKKTVYDYANYLVDLAIMTYRSQETTPQLDSYLPFWPLFRATEGDDKARGTALSLTVISKKPPVFAWNGDFIWLSNIEIENKNDQDNFGFVSQNYAAAASAVKYDNYHGNVVTCLHLCPDGFYAD